jgi:hypothetical protein
MTNRLRSRVLPLALLLSSGVAAAGPYDIPAGVEAVAKAQITAGSLEAPIRFLASDALEGRGPATRGDALARLYLAAELQSLGYLPGGEKGGWEQTVDVVGTTAQLPAVWSFTGKGANVDLKLSDDYIAGSGVQTSNATIKDAGVVFVGYGIEAPEYKWNDFKGVDVKGKVLVMLNNDPDWDPKLFAGNTRLYYGRWVYKYESAARHGAAGVIIVHTTPSAGYPWQVVQSSWGGEQFELPAEGRAARSAQGVGHRRGRTPPGEGGRAGSRQADRRREEPFVQARAAGVAHVDRCPQQGVARAHRERCRRAAGQRCEAQARSGRLLRSPRPLRHRRSGLDRRQHLQRRRRQRLGLRTAARHCARHGGAARTPRDGRCSCCSSPARSRGC